MDCRKKGSQPEFARPRQKAVRNLQGLCRLCYVRFLLNLAVPTTTSGSGSEAQRLSGGDSARFRHDPVKHQSTDLQLGRHNALQYLIRPYSRTLPPQVCKHRTGNGCAVSMQWRSFTNDTYNRDFERLDVSVRQCD